MRSVAALLLMAALSPSGFTQASEIKLQPKWKPEAIVRPPEIDKIAAKEAVKRFQKAVKTPDIDARMEAIKELIKGRNREMIKPLAPLLTKAEHPVRRTAAQALAAIGDVKAVTYIQRAMKASKNRSESDIMDALGTALGHCADPKKSMYSSHAKEFENGTKELKRALVLTFGHAKDRKALPLLAEWLAAPAPANPDSPSNPPASYWKARYAEWNFVKKHVGWAIWNITGDLLESKEEVEAWIAENKKKNRGR